LRTLLPAFVFVGIGVGAGTSIGVVKPEVQPRTKVVGLDAHETHASATLLGQFRTSISSYLWLRTDLYLHNGVEMRRLTDAEIQAGKKGVGSSDNHHGDHGHNDDFVVTVVPSADRDFRGFLGDIDRAKSAFKDMKGHSHQNPKQALPLFRLMTWVDPYFVPGWTTGASVLAMGEDRAGAEKAVQFLNDGLKHNPDSIAILNQLGYTHLVRLRSYQAAVQPFENAIKAAKSVPVERLDEEDTESLINAYRWLALTYRDTGELGSMYRVLREGVARFPDDVPLNRMLNVRPSIVVTPSKG